MIADDSDIECTKVPEICPGYEYNFKIWRILAEFASNINKYYIVNCKENVGIKFILWISVNKLHNPVKKVHGNIRR